MTSREFRDRLGVRATAARVRIPTDEEVQKLEAYVQLLAQWNAKINLTALPLRQPTDKTFDRLLVEPLAAAAYIAESATSWVDVGSGGGSPAIPLKIMHPHPRLMMVESRSRKAAFLREAVRVLGLANVTVEDRRFDEMVAALLSQAVDLFTVRGVRVDELLLSSMRGLLSAGGSVFLFHAIGSEPMIPSGFVVSQRVRLGTLDDSRLTILKVVFHVEQSD